MKTSPALAVAFLVVSIFTVSTLVWSAGAGDPLRTIPYQGRVEQAGQPHSGVVSMTFTLFDDDAAAPANQLWTNTRSVTITRGAFGVVLGAQTAIPQAAFDAAELFLAVDINGERLAGLQPISAVADAHRASTASLAEEADLATLAVEADDLTCPNDTLTDYGFCFLPAGPTNMTLNSAAAHCRGQGMRLCSSSEIAHATYLGYTRCTWSWVADYVSPTGGRIVLPSNGSDPTNCGAAGLNPVTANRSDTWSGFCCR